MADTLKAEDVQRLQAFIQACNSNPQIIHHPQLSFFREYLLKLGANIPEEETKASTSSPPPKDEPMREQSAVPEPEAEESDVDLDNEGVIVAETEAPPEMAEAGRVPTEEDIDASQEKRSEGMAAMADGDIQKAVDLFTEAIKLNPDSAMLYTKRANILLKQKRVNAAIRDCDEALKYNPDSAMAYKFRGQAHRLLGNWLEAARDLRLACRLDFDEETNEWLKEVQPNAAKLEEHNRKYERQRKDKEIDEKRERIKKAQEDAKKAQEEQKAGKKNPFGSFPGAGMAEGDIPGAPSGLGDIFKDPEILAAMQDPEIAAAFQDVSSNPSNIFKYQSNPKVAAIINKLISKLGGGDGNIPGGFPGMEGMGGGFPGGFPGAGGGFPGARGAPPTKPPSGSSDDLD